MVIEKEILKAKTHYLFILIKATYNTKQVNIIHFFNHREFFESRRDIVTK